MQYWLLVLVSNGTPAAKFPRVNLQGFPVQEKQISQDLLMHLGVAVTRSFCFPVLTSDVTDEMLSFFLTLFQGLRVQMGVPFTEQIIQTFLNMFTRYCPGLGASFLLLGMIYLIL